MDGHVQESLHQRGEHHHHHHHHHHPDEKKIDYMEEFNGTLWKAAHKSYSDNLIISPLNVSVLIAILRLGGKGNTYREILATMKFPDEHLMIEEFYKVIQAFKGTNAKEVDLRITNAFFCPSTCKFRKEVLHHVDTHLLASVIPVDFSLPDAAGREINSWVEQSCDSKIRDIISNYDLSIGTHLVGVNAIYFKGTWKYRFPQQKRTKQPFFISGGKKVEVDMMNEVLPCYFAPLPDHKAHAIGLSYAGDRYVLVIILPEKRYGLAETEKSLECKFCSSVHARITAEPKSFVDVHLPKCSIVSNDNVRSIFERIGMKSIFQEANAELSGCFDKAEKLDKKEKSDTMYVSVLVQQVCFEIGDEGLADTSISVGRSNSPENPVPVFESPAQTGENAAASTNTEKMPEIRTFRVDHPFLYYVIDESIGKVLFIGVHAKF